ncbi:unnamed protein product [Lampetra planeri]
MVDFPKWISILFIKENLPEALMHLSKSSKIHRNPDDRVTRLKTASLQPPPPLLLSVAERPHVATTGDGEETGVCGSKRPRARVLACLEQVSCGGGGEAASWAPSGPARDAPSVSTVAAAASATAFKTISRFSERWVHARQPQTPAGQTFLTDAAWRKPLSGGRWLVRTRHVQTWTPRSMLERLTCGTQGVRIAFPEKHSHRAESADIRLAAVAEEALGTGGGGGQPKLSLSARKIHHRLSCTAEEHL